jgi:hypothetical protein
MMPPPPPGAIIYRTAASSSSSAAGIAQFVLDEAAFSLSRSESVALSERDRENAASAGSPQEEPWGGMFFGQLFDSSPIKSLARRSFVS